MDLYTPEQSDLTIYHLQSGIWSVWYDTSTVMFDPAGHPFCLSTALQYNKERRIIHTPATKKALTVL